MTRLRSDPDGISNYFADLVDGLGRRGSSFADLDSVRVKAATHDGATARFLVQEFKRGDESLTEGQRRLLVGLARLPGVTCWLAIARPDRQIGWADFAQRSGLDVTIISPAEYARRFWVWWETDGARV